MIHYTHALLIINIVWSLCVSAIFAAWHKAILNDRYILRKEKPFYTGFRLVFLTLFIWPFLLIQGNLYHASINYLLNCFFYWLFFDLFINYANNKPLLYAGTQAYTDDFLNLFSERIRFLIKLVPLIVLTILMI